MKLRTFARLIGNPFCDVEILTKNELDYYKALKSSYKIVKYY